MSFLNQINEMHNLAPYLFKVQFNIILLSTPMSRKWSLHFRFHLSHACCIPFPPVSL